MKKRNKEVLKIFIRYLILILVAVPNLWLFYFIFKPLTIYPVYFLLSLFFNSFLINNVIIINNFPIEIINACVAGSAYYLLLILNLSTPKIEFSKRLKLIVFSFACLLILNILRIFLLSLIFVAGYSWFDITHRIFWYLVSTIFVIGIWFKGVKLFKIRKIPFYSDIIFLCKNLYLRKKTLSKRKKRLKRSKKRR